jgi:hypothetical protein
MAALLIANTDMESVSFVGPYETDGDLFTLTDEASGLSIGFEITEEEDGYLLDAGDFGLLALVPTDIETATTLMLVLAEVTTEVEMIVPGGEDADGNGIEDDAEFEDGPMDETTQYLLDNAQAAYLGMTDTDEEVVFIATADIAALAVVGSDMESVSYVGPYTQDGSMATITDQANGLTLSFEVIEEGDGYVLDLGDLGMIGLAPTDAETAVEALLLVSEYTNAVA